MKQLLILLLTFSISTLYAQQKGIYTLKYIGKIESEKLTIKSVKLPTTLYLHGLQQDKKNVTFYSTTTKKGKIELACASHLVDLRSVSFEELKSLYENTTSSLPIEVEISDGQNWSRTKKVFVTWDEVRFRQASEEQNETIIIDFGTINL
ncbi:MAG: hypothetical protein AB8G11_24225 [Saprospiraceae bacterium]